MLTDLIVVIISQHIHISDHHGAHLNLHNVVCQYISTKLDKIKEVSFTTERKTRFVLGTDFLVMGRKMV